MKRYFVFFLISILSALSFCSFPDGAIAWLQTNQNTSGSWGDEWEFADTCDVLSSLREVAMDCNSIPAGMDWLAYQIAPNLEFQSRQILALAGADGYQTITTSLVDELLLTRNAAETSISVPNWPEGGWGLDIGYETDCMTTAIAIMALKKVGLAGGMAVQSVSLSTGQHITYNFNVPADALKLRVRIDSLTGGPIQLRLQEGSEPPWAGISYFPISSAPSTIIYPDYGVAFTPGMNYLRVDSPSAGAVFSLTVSYETPTWDTRTLAEPMDYLRQTQNVDGGWGLQKGSATDLYTTLHVLLALQDYLHYGNQAELAAGMSWLRSGQFIDGSFGYDAAGTVIETALAARVLIEDDGYPFDTDTLDAIAWLENSQQLNGSWNDEPYDTALAMRALYNINQAPIADAGLDQWLIDTDATLAESVTLNGSGSSDIDGTIVSYVWTENNQTIATGINPIIEVRTGTHNLTLTVTDNEGKTATDAVQIKVTPPPQVFYSENMDVNPGWTTEGLWQWGRPTGQGGGYGDHDPTSGYTGTNVYGYNLAGAYTDNMSEMYLITHALDCSGYSNIQFSFYRWLNVQDSPWDNATVQVTATPADTESWVTIYQNPSDSSIGWLHEFSWSKQTYDISSIADNQPEVYIRWCMGSTDGMYAMAGWNIDDVELTGVVGPPDSPGVPDLLDEDDSGISSFDNNTGVEQVRVDVGVFNPDVIRVEIYNNGQIIGQATDLENGYWQYQFAAGQLSRGLNPITAVAGAIGGFSQPSSELLLYYKEHGLTADLDSDGIVELPDLVILATGWLTENSQINLSSGNLINFEDFNVLSNQWLLEELWFPVDTRDGYLL